MVYKFIKGVRGWTLGGPSPYKNLLSIPLGHEPQNIEETHNVSELVRQFLVKSILIHRLLKQSSFLPYEFL